MNGQVSFDRATQRLVSIQLEDDQEPGHPHWRAVIDIEKTAKVIAPVPEGHETYVLQTTIPGKVSEYYRQQGRRQLQRELQALLDV